MDNNTRAAMDELENIAASSEIEFLKWIKDDRGALHLCGIRRFMFTWGLLFGVNEIGFIGRWCFSNLDEALIELNALEEIPTNRIIPGNWKKYKGIDGEFENPNKKTIG